MLRDSKCYDGPPFRVGASGSQVINRTLAQVHLMVSLLGPWTYPVVITQLSKNNQMYICGRWKNPHIGSFKLTPPSVKI